MPSPKRWFPVSRDLNDDPELWEFTDTFGDRALRVWLEILAILDKSQNCWRLTDGAIAAVSRKCRHTVAKVRRIIDWLVAQSWLRVDEPMVAPSPQVLSAPNYWKYHRKPERIGNEHGSGTESDMVPPLPEPSRTDLAIPPSRPPTGDCRRDALSQKKTASRRNRTSEQVTWHPEWFNQLWAMYPRKEGKQKAIQAWNVLHPDEPVMQAIQEGLTRHQASDQWQRENRRFVPYLSTFLKQHRWEEHPIEKDRARREGFDL